MEFRFPEGKLKFVQLVIVCLDQTQVPCSQNQVPLLTPASLQAGGCGLMGEALQDFLVTSPGRLAS